MFSDIIEIIAQYKEYLIKGSISAIMYALVGTIVGFVIGLITGIIRTTPLSKNKVVAVFQRILNVFISAYVEVFRGTPLMVQAMVIYWGYAFATGGQTLNLTLSGFLIVSINTGAYMAEIVRGGIISIDKGQFEGATALGMSHWQTMIHVIIPQLVRNILPSTSNEFINNIKDTSVLNVIGVTELYYFSGIIKRNTFKTFETYAIVCVIYLIINITCTKILRFFEKKLEGNDNYQMIGALSKSTFTTKGYGIDDGK